MTYVVRTALDPVSLLPSVKQEIWAVNKNLPFSSVTTMEDLFSRSIGARRFNLLLLGSFAGAALILAIIGVYGVMSFSVRQRSHDIGVRMALGASPVRIRRIVMSEGLILTVTGVTVGVIGAWAVTRFLQSLLFGVPATDPLTFGGVTVLLVAVAMLATYLPARRATKVDPLMALRTQ
jgi:ABC-type antimicrobial peptide transport system permease subunit